MSLLREAQTCIANQASRKSLNAFISLAGGASILRKAEAADTQRDRGPLHGRLIAIKDNICTSELPTTSASGILKTFTSPYDATVVKKIQKAGGIVSGKTNLDEFGMGSHSKCSYFGAVTQNDASRGEALSAGGSSGGSAVAVATGQCWAALGTDTGGSVRLPAAYTGIIGFKPSYGLVSRWGVLAYANSLDTVGVLAQSTQHAEAVFEAINGYDEQDPTSLTPTTRTRISNLLSQRRRNSSLRIGVPLEYNIAELSPEVRCAWIRALELLRNQGHTILPVSIPTTKRALSAYYVLAPAEASSNLAKYDGVRYGTRAEGPDGAEGVLFSKTRGQGFGDEVKRRVLLGAYTLSAEAIDNYFIQAQKVRRLVQQDFDRVFSLANPLLDVRRTGRQNTDERVDVLVCPTAPTLPPTLESLEKQSPVEAYVSDIFTVPASLAGLPAVSVPFKESQGQEGNIGIQVIAQYGDDNLTLDVARIIEETR
ncbi:Trimeric GatFAB AmidoTransferase(AdT) complex subunit [Coniosporium apollinis]|uniref:Glutamyl-tRNA(Gln) amidotransferase subunit A, mitochondrial n=1 Tax=Coniosporium apollinis TaxID=61459 RepID=A0ABQ9NPZ0_9PEZI|nr:Trimeric GatFAB AmidoTransferase(AdT) complex subunit [Coniosporium apollinis]